MPRQARLTGLAAIAFSVACAFAIPNNMLARAGYPDDSAVFAYVGWLMTRGYLPYRDVWDHKGPLLYDLNWLGWQITPGSTVGIGLLQVLVYAASFYLLIRLLRQSRIDLSTIALTAAFAVSALSQWSNGGNMAETWAIGAVAACHAVAYSGLRTRIHPWHFAALGVAFAACFWIRPNLCVFPALALLAVGHLQRVRRGLLSGLSGQALATLTLLLLSALLLLPLFLAHALRPFTDAYFAYNAAYSRFATLQEHLAGAAGLALLSLSIALPVIAVCGWIALFRTQLDIPHLYRVLLFAAFPLEFLAAALSGRLYYHYLASLWPTAFVIAAIGLHQLRTQLWRPRRKILAAAVLIATLIWEGRRYQLFETKATRHLPALSAVAAFIDANTTTRDKILPVGNDAAVAAALESRREPAGRYVFQLALVHRANPHAQQDQSAELAAIGRDHPKIVFSFPSEIGNLCGTALPLPEAEREGYQSGRMRHLLEPILLAQYEEVHNPDFGSGCVFRRR